MKTGSRRNRKLKKKLSKIMGPFCYYCHKFLHRNDVTLDHVVSLSKGGKTSLCNCVISCSDCNNKKADIDLKEFSPSAYARIYHSKYHPGK